jgi:hypothetical protein
MSINVRQNKNSKNAGFGKYYPEVDMKETLSLKGFAQHMIDHGSKWKLGELMDVLRQVTECLPELVAQGVPVQLEPLGTFYPSAKVDKPLLNLAAFEGADPNAVVKGIHIRFLPYGVEDDNITSRRFKEDWCTLQWGYLVESRTLTIDGKKKMVQDKTPWATVIADYRLSQQSSGDNSGNSGGSDLPPSGTTGD